MVRKGFFVLVVVILFALDSATRTSNQPVEGLLG
jgi:hypothetical protein